MRIMYMYKFKDIVSVLIVINILSATIPHASTSLIDQDTTSALSYHGEDSNLQTDIDSEDALATGNVGFAEGMVSVDCLRCLCLKQSNCKPVGCSMRFSLLKCGYFQITSDIWTDCGELGPGWKKCANDVTCSSQCIQNYMRRYAERYNCVLKCEGFTRELFGGPNGCNNPVTIPYWEAVQNVPGCKGVE